MTTLFYQISKEYWLYFHSFYVCSSVCVAGRAAHKGMLCSVCINDVIYPSGWWFHPSQHFGTSRRTTQLGKKCTKKWNLALIVGTLQSLLMWLCCQHCWSSRAVSLRSRGGLGLLPPGGGGVPPEEADVQHFFQLPVFLCRVKFGDPQYPDGFVFKATLLPRAK